MSGGSVATERAFIQVGVMFTAVILDRRAITLRSVAIAALVVLFRRPETLMGPGFQMSFAATAALVAVFNALRGHPVMTGQPLLIRGPAALVISSAVAGAATAPFSAGHFNLIAVYGLLANLLTVPVMGSVVIPMAVVALVLWPFGLEAAALWVMEHGLVWILGVAGFVADLPGATRPISAPPQGILGLIAFGGMMLILWRGRGRVLGVLPLLAALVLWSGADRPDVLLSPNGRLAGALTAQGNRALSKYRGDGFVARTWLQNDGDSANQATAAARAGWWPETGGQVVTLASGVTLWHGTGRGVAEHVAEACARYDVVLTSADIGPDVPELGTARTWVLNLLRGAHGARLPPGPRRLVAPAPLSGAAGAACLLIDSKVLAQTGSLAFHQTHAGLTMTTARGVQGARLWTQTYRGQ